MGKRELNCARILPGHYSCQVSLNMKNFFRRFWRQNNERPPAMLSEAKACAIASTALADSPYGTMMTMARLDNREGKQVWIVGSATIGSGMTVIVDDGTGEVLSREPWGVR
jgi:hypothetical protein